MSSANAFIPVVMEEIRNAAVVVRPARMSSSLFRVPCTTFALARVQLGGLGLGLEFSTDSVSKTRNKTTSPS
jgi:hypothetical protein